MTTRAEVTPEEKARKDAARVAKLEDQLYVARLRADKSFERMLDYCRKTGSSYAWDKDGLPFVVPARLGE